MFRRFIIEGAAGCPSPERWESNFSKNVPFIFMIEAIPDREKGSGIWSNRFLDVPEQKGLVEASPLDPATQKQTGIIAQ